MDTASKQIRGKKDEFNFLLELAKRLGATEAKIVRSDRIVVEDRVLLKCRSRCHLYGHKLVCPPFAPTPDEFRRILGEYEDVLIVKFLAKAEAGKNV